VSDVGDHYDRAVVAQHAVLPAFDITLAGPKVKHSLIDAHLSVL
jgi:hypothetical protein